MTEHDDEELPAIHPKVLASNQVVEAMMDLERHPSAFLRWPYPELDAMTGALGAGGEVWFVCAFSGGGKTTFVGSTVEAWRAQGKRIYIMPLETKPKTFRTYLACMETGIHPGDALTGEMMLKPDGPVKRARLIAALKEQAKSPYVDQVMVSSQKMIDVRGLERGLKEAKAFGADVVIVDHIDHIEAENAKSLYEASRQVNHAALRMAQDNDLLLLFTSQLNLDIARSQDHLARYAPPRDQHVLMGNQKRQIATGMIGLYRKVRERRANETQEDYEALIRAARAGGVSAPEVLDTTVMGVNAMKLRHYGAREGGRVLLGFENGKVYGIPEKDNYQTGFGGTMREVYGGK